MSGVYTEAYVPPTLFADERDEAQTIEPQTGVLAARNGYVPASVVSATSELWQRRATYWPSGLPGTPNIHDMVVNGWFAKPGAMVLDPWATDNPAAGVVCAAHGIGYHGYTTEQVGDVYAGQWGQGGRELWDARNTGQAYRPPVWGPGLPLSADVVHGVVPADYTAPGQWKALAECVELLDPDRYVVLYAPVRGTAGSGVFGVLAAMRGLPGVRLINEVAVVGPRPIPAQLEEGRAAPRVGHLLVYVKGDRKAAARWVTDRV